MIPIPITIITGFLGSGKTTLILNLIPQLRAANPSYRVALIKNEFGDVAVDSQLASASAVSGVRELLGGCVCCNLVGSLGDALAELNSSSQPANPAVAGGAGSNASTTAPPAAAAPPNRIIIETSGSAFPATLALEVNRLARATGGAYVLDGVVTVVDVENWRGYEDTSYTARVQARYTDLIVYNKWEDCSEMRLDECRDRVGDLEVEAAWVRSRRGWVDKDVVLGIDRALAGSLEGEDHGREHEHGRGGQGHQSEVEVLSVELGTREGGGRTTVDLDKLGTLLKTAPRDEVYRIKAVLTASRMPLGSDIAGTSGDEPTDTGPGRYILNWAFGRWTFTPLQDEASEHVSSRGTVLRMSVILARYEASKWMKKIRAGGLVEPEGGGLVEAGGGGQAKGGMELTVKRVA